LDPLLASIREEIYTQPYGKIRFAQHRYTTAPTDAMRSISPVLVFLFSIITIWCDLLRPLWLHRIANRRVSELMKREERNTDYECLAPVNKAFHMATAWFEEGPDSERLQRHREKVDLYLWVGPNGMTSNGTNGVQVWDTAFSAQAAVTAGIAAMPEFAQSIHMAHDFLDKSQLRDNLADPFRQPRKGGWAFSTKSNGFIVSDCAAEGLKAVLMLQNQR
jgi:lanosterol synthase